MPLLIALMAAREPIYIVISSMYRGYTKSIANLIAINSAEKKLVPLVSSQNSSIDNFRIKKAEAD